MKRILLALSVTALTFAMSIGGVLLSTQSVSAVSPAAQAACDGVALTGDATCGQTNADGTSASDSTVTNTIKLVINIFSLVVGFTAVIMIMIGGFKYITSTGDSASVNSAKNTILYAIVGLIIVALAQVIVKFVLGRL